MKTKRSIIYYILGVIGVLILINIIADRFFFRLDFTEDGRYTLNKATKDILANLKETVTINAYFSEDMPPDIAKTKRDFKELLAEYASRSKGKIVYEFINPNKDEEMERKANQAGVQPVVINVRDKDQVKQQKAYLGAVVQMGEQSDVIPFMQPGSAMEYALSSSLKKISVKDKPRIGFLQGHGEPPINQFQQAMAALNVLYGVYPVTLTDTANNLDKFSTVAIIAPKDSFSAGHLKQLDNFLANGKRLFIALNRVKGDFSTATGSPVNTGLETWLAEKGVIVENLFIVDANCGNVGVTQQQGMFSYQTNVRFPYLPVITSFADHPVTKGLEAVLLPFASPMAYTGKNNAVTFTPIAKTSKKTGTQPANTMFDIRKQWTDRDFPMTGQIVAGILSGKIIGNNESKIVIVSDGDFAVNGEGRQAMQQQPDNISLFVNSIDWLSDDTGLIDLRTKGVTSRPLDQVEEGTKMLLKWLNFLLPIILIILFGIVRFQRNRSLRNKRMEEGYV
ncbi:MAG: Gldg family protein [Bacteroidia bacterium]|nr:Gldg family protein [Bacteroidia bacterium]